MMRGLAIALVSIVAAGCGGGSGPTTPTAVNGEPRTQAVDPNGGRQVYELGYVLGEFIVNRWGRAAFLRLIQTNADLQSVLGVSTTEFESAWQS